MLSPVPPSSGRKGELEKDYELEDGFGRKGEGGVGG